MTKEAKSIIKKDIKKYQTLSTYANEENQEEFLKIANFLQSILEK